MSRRYDLTSAVREGEQLVFCRDCGCVVCDFATAAHDKFHEDLAKGTLDESAT